MTTIKGIMEIYKMAIKDLLDLAGKQRKAKKRAQTVKNIAMATGIVAAAAVAGVATGVLIAPKSGKETRKDMKDKVLSFNDAVQRRTETFKKSAAYSAQTVGNAIKDAHEKAEGVKADARDGLHEINQDAHNAARHIINEFDSL